MINKNSDLDMFTRISDGLSSLPSEKLALLIGAAFVILAWLFAPLTFQNSYVTRFCGFNMITTPGRCNDLMMDIARIDWPILLTEWLGILIVTFLLYYVLKK